MYVCNSLIYTHPFSSLSLENAEEYSQSHFVLLDSSWEKLGHYSVFYCFPCTGFPSKFQNKLVGEKRYYCVCVCVCVCVCLHNSSHTENVSSVKDLQTLLCASKIFLPVICFSSLLISNPFLGWFADVLHLGYATRLMASNLQLWLSFFCKLGLGLGQLWVKNILG